MANIYSDLILYSVPVHIIDLVLRLRITGKCGDNIKRVVREQSVNVAECRSLRIVLGDVYIINLLETDIYI